MSIAILILSAVFFGGEALYGQRNIVENIIKCLFGGNNPEGVRVYSFGGNGKHRSVANFFGGNNKPFGSNVLLFGGN